MRSLFEVTFEHFSKTSYLIPSTPLLPSIRLTSLTPNAAFGVGVWIVQWVILSARYQVGKTVPPAVLATEQPQVVGVVRIKTGAPFLLRSRPL